MEAQHLDPGGRFITNRGFSQAGQIAHVEDQVGRIQDAWSAAVLGQDGHVIPGSVGLVEADVVDEHQVARPHGAQRVGGTRQVGSARRADRVPTMGSAQGAGVARDAREGGVGVERNHQETLRRGASATARLRWLGGARSRPVPGDRAGRGGERPDTGFGDQDDRGDGTRQVSEARGARVTQLGSCPSGGPDDDVGAVRALVPIGLVSPAAGGTAEHVGHVEVGGQKADEAVCAPKADAKHGGPDASAVVGVLAVRCDAATCPLQGDLVAHGAQAVPSAQAWGGGRGAGDLQDGWAEAQGPAAR